MPPDSPAAPVTRRPVPADGCLGLVLPTFPQGTFPQGTFPQGTVPPGITTPGITPNAGLPLAADALAEVCQRAEDAGAGALWACDHLFWHGPNLEAFAALGVAATATTHAAVGTCVLQLPLRHAASVAKQAASLAYLAGGRLILGVGVGAHPGEYEAAGVDFGTRGARLDEAVDDLRAAWAPDASQRYAQLPAPGAIPVWVGGSSEAALRRAARRGDGWIPLFLGPGEYADAMERLDKETERAGRDPVDVRRAMVVFVSVGTEDAGERGLDWMGSLYGLPGRSFARHLVAGDARHCARTLARFAEAGAQHVAVFLTVDGASVQFEDLAGEFAGLAAGGARRPARADAPGGTAPGADERTTVPARR